MSLMDNILSVDIEMPRDIAEQIAANVKAWRLELNLTQEGAVPACWT